MKKIICMLLAVCLLIPSLALAKGKAKDEPIPDFCKPILEAWNATTGEELLLNILEYQKNSSPEEPPASFSPKYRPCSIRFGGTTKELIADKKNWDLAIVSSKDVDLQKLADEGLIMSQKHIPASFFAYHQWLAPKELQQLLPSDPMLTFYILFFDYDETAADATLLICQADIGRKKNHPRAPYQVATDLMSMQSTDEARSVQGIRIRRRDEGWTEDKLLAQPDDWDVAILTIEENSKLEKLDAAGLLYDLSQESYFVNRTAIRPFEPSIERGMPPRQVLPNGIFSANGRMIAIPVVAVMEDEYDGTLGVMIVNSKSPVLEHACEFAVHEVKSLEWFWTVNDGNYYISKDEVDW